MILLAVLLFVPVSRIVLVMSVRGLQARRGRMLEPDELAGQLRRARFISFFLSAIFSLLFCLQRLGFPAYG